jgi:hypothetical protein
MWLLGSGRSNKEELFPVQRVISMFESRLDTHSNAIKALFKWGFSASGEFAMSGVTELAKLNIRAIISLYCKTSWPAANFSSRLRNALFLGGGPVSSVFLRGLPVTAITVVSLQRV